MYSGFILNDTLRVRNTWFNVVTNLKGVKPEDINMDSSTLRVFISGGLYDETRNLPPCAIYEAIRDGYAVGRCE